MRDFPSIILNTPKTTHCLRQLFGYEAKFYDLDAYEEIQEGLGKRIWNEFLNELKRQEFIEKKLLELETKLCKPWYHFGWPWKV